MSYQKKIQAGKQAEMDAKYQLSVIAKRIPGIHVFHDIKFQSGDFNVQIDHLVMYAQGFIIIESKSIHGEVRVNELGEWSRSYKGQWYGFKSPFKQVEVQKFHLKAILHENRRELLDKVLIKLQPTFGGREWSALACISSSSIIHRNDAPKELRDFIVKTEFLFDAINGIVNKRRSLATPKFSQKNIELVAAYLEGLQNSETQAENSIIEATAEALIADNTPLEAKNVESGEIPTQEGIKRPGSSPHLVANCNKCASTSLEPMYGKFGYYFKCSACNSNTPMPRACPQCNSKQSRTKKRGDEFFVPCTECGVTTNIRY